MNESPSPNTPAYKSKKQIRKELFERVRARGLNMMDVWQVQDSGGIAVWQMYTGNKYQKGSADQ